VCIWSRCIRVVAPSPSTVFTSTGKNTIATTTAAFDCQSKPNHMTRIGAVPTIGRAAMKLPTGNSPRFRNPDRSMAMAVRIAAEQPIAQPVSAPRTKVCTKSVHRMGRLCATRAAMAEGGGRITEGTSSPRTSPSHSTSRVRPNSAGTASRVARVFGRAARRALSHQAKPQNSSAAVTRVIAPAPCAAASAAAPRR